MIGTFKGGVHPFEGKDLSKNKPVTELKPGNELVYPLSQHIGAPAKPVVAVGDTVKRGQLIAESGGFVSANIFSSVSGKVKSITPRRVATGDMVQSIVIENDGQYDEVDFVIVDDVTSLSKEEIIEKVKYAGVVGMGGAGFPTHVKLSPKDPDKIEYIIANCAECEPYLTSDYRQMIDDPESLIEGMKIVLRLFDNAKGVLGIEDNKPDAIKKLTELTASEPNITVMSLRTKYPQGGERQLIKAVTGREINSRMLPADAGCIVDNVATLVAIYNAVKYGKPIINRIFTVSGDAVSDPKNFYVCTGMNVADILAAAGGCTAEPEKYISGGPMMGFAMFDINVPVTKTGSSILAFKEDQVVRHPATACINCGRCVEVCPEQLVPSRLAKFSEHNDMETFEKWYGVECIECGSCSFVCPAKKHLAQSIKTMKRSVMVARRTAAAKK